MSQWPRIPYQPRHATWPYTTSDFERMDDSRDEYFYSRPRFVTHIDDHAISCLKEYYDHVLPHHGRILDFCSSWISHYPQRIHDAANAGDVDVIGLGMNKDELEANPLFFKDHKKWKIQNLNINPELDLGLENEHEKLDAATCVVSIDYLSKPKEVLESVRKSTKEGGRVHLSVSNRCFPTKVVKLWLHLGEEERLRLVADYVHFAGWKEVEILKISGDSVEHDPLWVVRGVNHE